MKLKAVFGFAFHQLCQLKPVQLTVKIEAGARHFGFLEERDILANNKCESIRRSRRMA